MEQETAVATPAAGQVARQDMAGQELEVRGETAISPLVAQAEAREKVRFLIALKRPRNMDEVRLKLLNAIERPGWAGVPGKDKEKNWGAAWYDKPIGTGVEGFSIRFAEEAMLAMGNIDVAAITLYEDERVRQLQLVVLDLENNNSYPASITIEKTVIRKSLRRGETSPFPPVINSFGDVTYKMPASQDDMTQKQASEISKAMRTGIMRILPGWIKAECRTRILELRRGAVAKDPDGFRKKILDGFAALNIMPSDLEKLLGCEVAKASPDQLADLRDLWKNIANGDETFADALEGAGKGEKKKDKPEKKKPGLDALTEELKKKRAACGHEKLPPSKVSKLKAGQTLPCPECGTEVSNPEASAQATLEE